MRYTILVLTMVLMSCGTEEVITDTSTDILGDWQHSLSCFSNGGSALNCVDYQEREIFKFRENGVFLHETFLGEDTGSYVITPAETDSKPRLLTTELDGSPEGSSTVYEVRILDGSELQLIRQSVDGVGVNCSEECYESFSKL